MNPASSHDIVMPSAAPPRPLRLTVVGNSQAVMCSPRGGPRTDRTYAQWLHRFPTRLGTTVEVTNLSLEVTDVTRALRLAPAVAEPPTPDVVLVNIGTAEAFAVCTPQWLWHLFLGSERHAGLRHRVFDRLRPRLWPLVRAYQRAVDRRLGHRGGRVSAARFERDLRRLIERLRSDTGALVLVADIVPLERIAQNTPAAPERLRRIQDALVRTVDSLQDSEVHLVPFSKIVEAEFGVRDGLPDGYHFSPAVHRRVAEELWHKVSSWEEARRGQSTPARSVAPTERSVPLRVAVVGGGEPISQAHGARTIGAPSYVELLGAATTAAGTGLEVVPCLRPGGDVRVAIDEFQTAVQQPGPDVVILHSAGARRLLGRVALPMAPARLGRELRIAIALARRVSSPLVLVIDAPVPPPGGRSLLRALHRAINRRIAVTVAAEACPDVRVLPLSVVIEAIGPPGARRPDVREGWAEAHRRLTALALEEISAWELRRQQATCA